MIICAFENGVRGGTAKRSHWILIDCTIVFVVDSDMYTVIVFKIHNRVHHVAIVICYIYTVPLSWLFWVRFSTGKTSARGDTSEKNGRLVSISFVEVTVDRIYACMYSVAQLLAIE